MEVTWVNLISQGPIPLRRDHLIYNRFSDLGKETL